MRPKILRHSPFAATSKGGQILIQYHDTTSKHSKGKQPKKKKRRK